MITCAPLSKSPYCASHSTKAPRLLHVVAVLEAERRRFRQRAVVDFVGGFGLWQLLQRVNGSPVV